MNPTQEQIELAAAAIANARGGRRGMPPVTNILEMLPANLVAEVTEDAEAALEAAGLGPAAGLRVLLEGAAETIAAVADRINDACNGGGEISGGETVDPLMRVHGELLAALAEESGETGRYSTAGGNDPFETV